MVARPHIMPDSALVILSILPFGVARYALSALVRARVRTYSCASSGVTSSSPEMS